MRPRVVVVGLGDTGLLVAMGLADRCDVVAIGPRDVHISGQEVGLRLVRPKRWGQDYWTSYDRYRRLDAVRRLRGTVEALDLAARTVTISIADGKSVVERYDVVVIATGVGQGFWRDAQKPAERILAEMPGQGARLMAASTVAVVGGGATGVSVAYNLAAAGNEGVALYHTGDWPLPGYHPRARRDITRSLREAGVQVLPNHRAIVPDALPASRIGSEEVAWSTGQSSTSADAVFWAVGRVSPHSEFLPPSMLDEAGFIQVDEFLRLPGYVDAFAVGDVAATDEHRSSARNKGAELVVRNVRAHLVGRGLKRFRPPPYRWGSVLGPQADGWKVYFPNGSAVRFPRWFERHILTPLIVRRLIWKGLRPSHGSPARLPGTVND